MEKQNICGDREEVLDPSKDFEEQARMKKVQIELAADEIIALQAVIEEMRNEPLYNFERDIYDRVQEKLCEAYQKPEMTVEQLEQIIEEYHNEMEELGILDKSVIHFLEHAKQYLYRFYFDIKE